MAATDCKYAKQENIDFDLLWDLVEVEKKYGVPPELRGMVLAAACMESGYNRDARGDRRFSKSGKRPMAAGILQQWPFYERVYGTDRADPISCADSWLKHIVSKLKKVDCSVYKDSTHLRVSGASRVFCLSSLVLHLDT